MTSLHINESVPQCKNCRCGEGDTNIWTTKTPGTAEKQTNKCQNCQVLKSGPLLISSKGIGWTSWKKRWFILTRTSLVFFRSDPNAPPQKGSEPNLTLGGIDLSSSGSIVVKADKKLLTVLFPDGRDGRTFTLKAETLEDLNEWKTALENALAQAPSGTPGVGQSEVPHIDVSDSVESSFEQRRDKRPVKSFVVGRPVLLALEDIDGSPSFLEKALRFIEQHGIKVEGILRQSADVEEVERRVQEYEQGKDEFSVEEDAHVIGDCIKYVLRELPSSPVPASCCTALVEAYKTDRRSRVDALRMAISDTFPEPNLHLLQRILKMMRIVASNKSVNRMSLSAVAACMAPLLLRPLLAGDCEVENDFNMGGDGSLQLLQAAAAANHAQAIVMILLEEYETIFDEDLSQEGSYSSEVYTDSDDGYNEDEELTDDDLEDDGNQDTENDLEEDIDDDLEHLSSEKLTEGGSEVGSDLSEDKALKDKNYSSISGKKAAVEIPVAPSNTAIIPSISMKEDIDERQTSPTHAAAQHAEVSNNERKKIRSVSAMTASGNAAGCNFNPASTMHKSVSDILSSSVASFSESGTEPSPTSRKPTILGRTSARKNLSMESIDLEFEDEIAIQKLENTKSGLHNKIMKEVKGNEILQESLEKRKEALRAQRVALERDVKKLREQLQKERELRVSLEAGLMNMRPGHVPVTSSVDNKTRADLEEIALAEADIINLNHKVADLRGQLSLQLKHGYASLCESCGQQLYKMHHQSDGKKELKDVDCSAVVQLIDNLAKSEGALPGRGSQNVQQDMPHSKQEPSQKMLLEPISQKDDASSQITHPSSTKDSTSGTIAPSKNSWSKDESLLCGKHCEDVQTKTPESPFSSSMQPSQKHQLNKLNENNSEALRADTTPVVQKAASRRTTSKSNSQADFPRKESHALNASIAHPKSHVQDSRSSLNVPASLRQQVNAENATRTKSLGTNSDQSIGESLTVGCNIALAKSFSGTQSVKCETEDSCFLQNRQDSQKQQSNTSNLSSYKHFNPDGLTSSEDQATASHGVSSRKHSMIGEAASTSTALAKLTNRLAFLKERRIQLVNELQNLDTNRAQNFDLNRIAGLEGRPLKTNPR